ncbi:MAG TPA: DNA (cytosine-5-)-methyltransferase [Gemmatimonadaceae bacterium]|nr:DNA (cytosine-5-)-methyltransferase [Gemmatimonadaceae bacterium]
MVLPHELGSGSELRALRQNLGLSQSKLSEVTGVPQHVLSAYELGKEELSREYKALVLDALYKPHDLKAVATRRKRYRTHRFTEAKRDPDRIEKARRTPGNPHYLKRLEMLAQGHLEKKDAGLTAVSLFSGCGGFSLGFSAAGFSILGHVEINSGFKRIYSENFARSLDLGDDIREFDNTKIVGISKSIPKVDILIGGPPCQGFSLAGKRKTDDPRNELFRHYMDFVTGFQPKIAVIENVRLLTSMKTVGGTYVKDEIMRAFSECGYDSELFLVNAQQYGVPQSRERVLFVAVRKDLGFKPSIPAPTHGALNDLFSLRREYVTFGDACSDLPYLESGEESIDPLHSAVAHPQHVVDWLWDVAEGHSAHENADPDLRPPSGYNTTYKRQVWNQPAATVQTTFGMISGCNNVHPIATRSMTIREAARVQSFPDSFKFVGTAGDIRSSIGNAVPPLLSYAVAKHLRRLL